jgi:hypothetical protein
MWPTTKEFRAAGKYALRQAMTRTGGLEEWAPVFPHVRCPQLHRWTDDELRRELLDFCDGRTRFPTEADFRMGNRVGLYRALGRRGRDWWADEIVLPRARRANPAATHDECVGG